MCNLVFFASDHGVTDFRRIVQTFQGKFCGFSFFPNKGFLYRGWSKIFWAEKYTKHATAKDARIPAGEMAWRFSVGFCRKSNFWSCVLNEAKICNWYMDTTTGNGLPWKSHQRAWSGTTQYVFLRLDTAGRPNHSWHWRRHGGIYWPHADSKDASWYGDWCAFTWRAPLLRRGTHCDSLVSMWSMFGGACESPTFSGHFGGRTAVFPE